MSDSNPVLDIYRRVVADSPDAEVGISLAIPMFVRSALDSERKRGNKPYAVDVLFGVELLAEIGRELHWWTKTSEAYGLPVSYPEQPASVPWSVTVLVFNEDGSGSSHAYDVLALSGRPTAEGMQAARAFVDQSGVRR